MSTLLTRVVSTVSVGTILVSTYATSVVSAASEFLPYAELLASNGIINTQVAESGYRLADSITRAEMAKIAVNLAGVVPTGCLGNMYSDVPTSNSLCAYVEAAADAGIVSVNYSNFRPSDLVTRAEMVKMLLGAVGQSTSATSAGYMDVTSSLGDLEGYINRAYELGCARAATYFRPNANSSRGEAFKIAACVAGVDVVPVTPPTNGSGDTNTGVVVPTVSGSLVASLSGTAVAAYVPMNASSVNVGTVLLTAGQSAVTIQSMVVQRSGLGNAGDIESNGIHASVNGVMVSSTADYYNATSQKATLYFTPALTIPAGTSVPVSILVSLSGSQNSQHKFSLMGINSNTSTVSGLPVDLGFLNTTSYVTATTNYNVHNQPSVTPGKSQQVFAKIDVVAGNRDTIFNSIVLTRSGASDLTKRFNNVNVYQNGAKVGTASVTSDKIVISGVNQTLLAGNTQTYELRGDILVDSSSSNNSLQLVVNTTSDASATEVSTGYATRSNTSYDSTITFQNLQVTFSKTSTGSQTIAPGTNNVTFFGGKLTSAVPLIIKQLTINPSISGSGIELFVNNSLSVRVNGAEIGTLTSLTGAVVLPVSFVVDPTTPAEITIVGNIRNTPTGTNNYTFIVSLSEVRDINNNTATIGAGGSTSGDRTTVATATLTLKSATIAAPSSAKIYSSAEQEIGRFAVTASNEAIRLEDVVLTNVGTATLQNLAISTTSARLIDLDSGSEIAATVDLSSNTLKFEDMSYTIAQNVTKNFKILLNTISLESYYGQGVQLTLSPSSVTAVRDSNGNTLTGAALLGTTTNLKAYTIGIEPPTVKVEKTSDLNRYLVTINNVDANTGLTVTGVTLRFQYRYAGQGSSTALSGTLVCLRDQGSSSSCGGVGTTAGTSVLTFTNPTTIALTGLTASTFLDKSTGSMTFEVYLDPEPLFVSGDYTQVSVTQVGYTVG